VVDYTSFVIANGILIAELAMASCLVLGGFLARSGRIRLHAYLQSTVVLGNVPVILVWMLPAYLTYVVPALPGELDQPYYWVPTLMLALGLVVEVLGAYVIVVAGTNWLPERFRFRQYKLWMRTVLVLWWVVLLTGIATYYLWLVAPASS
jgi:uncharacterized membrane protein YozB (DUF420 family)